MLPRHLDIWLAESTSDPQALPKFSVSFPEPGENISFLQNLSDYTTFVNSSSHTQREERLGLFLLPIETHFGSRNLYWFQHSLFKSGMRGGSKTLIFLLPQTRGCLGCCQGQVVGRRGKLNPNTKVSPQECQAPGRLLGGGGQRSGEKCNLQPL